MAVTLTKSNQEIQQMPLVEIVYEILKVRKEPLYFRDLMKEIQELRSLSDEQVTDVIARVFTEINIDGRFICVGQNVWGLIRWYPTEKPSERLNGKKFVRKTGDAFGDDDDDDDDSDYDDVDSADVEDADINSPAADDEADFAETTDDDDEDDDDDETATAGDFEEEEEETLFVGDEEEEEEED